MKASNFCHCLKHRPLLSSFHFLLINFYSLRAYIKFHFFYVCAQYVHPQYFENFIKMLQMLFLTSTINEDVIKINNEKFTNERLEYLVHQSHENTLYIGQSKRHDKSFIKSFTSLESFFPFITKSNTNLMVSTSKINIGKHI